MIVTLSGSDGVGKSTQLRMLLKRLDAEKRKYKVMYVRVGRTPVSKWYKRVVFRRGLDRSPTPGSLKVKIGLILATLELIYYWSIKIRFLNKKRSIILCDRYLWDSYVDLSDGFIDWDPSNAIWRFLSKYTARPDISILYIANEAVINRRLQDKEEQPDLEKVRAKNRLYETLYEKFDHVIDASTEKEEVFRATCEVLKTARGHSDSRKYVQKILQRIKPLLSESDSDQVEIRRVEKGNSTAQNYCILISGTPIFFVKTYERKNRIHSLLKLLDPEWDAIVCPLLDFSLGSKRCMITKWLECSKLAGNTSEAYQVADILKKLHAHVAPTKGKHTSHKLELRHYLQYLKLHKVEFAHQQDILSYLKKHTFLCRDVLALTHMDVHLRNFVVDNSGKIVLIDYENLAFTDPWRDFVYACFFHNKSEDAFWQTVILAYFENHVPENFWTTMKYYCYMQLLRMIICEHKKGNYTKLDSVVESIFKNWCCNSECLPAWRFRLPSGTCW